MMDFTSPGLSRRMNRLLSNFGKKRVKKKLLALSEEFKIEKKITEVNPAYTSQECSECGYIDKKNRKNQSCLFADVETRKKTQC